MSSPREATAELAAWGDPPLRWLEDPFPPHDVGALVGLRSLSAVRLGVGDDVTDEWTAARLLDHVEVLRVDATTIGGLGPALALALRAGETGIPVSLHIYPSLHLHLALASEAVERIESFGPDRSRLDPLELLFRSTVESASGRAAIPSRPGLGLELDEELVARYRLLR